VAPLPAAQAAHAAAKASGHVPASILHQALAVGIDRGFEVAAGIALLALVIVIATIRLRSEDMTGVSPMPAGGPPAQTAGGEELELEDALN
jgi:hypothetical protein